MRALTDADLAHLSVDARRVYSLLLAEWLTYLGHLREDYPYLYSLALRTNPFDPSASVGVREEQQMGKAMVGLETPKVRPENNHAVVKVTP